MRVVDSIICTTYDNETYKDVLNRIYERNGKVKLSECDPNLLPELHISDFNWWSKFHGPINLTRLKDDDHTMFILSDHATVKIARMIMN